MTAYETPATDVRMLAAAVALWREFDYLLPAAPDVVARIALEAADKASAVNGDPA